MAIYHLTAKTVSRGESASAAVRSDYIERSGRYASDHAEVLLDAHEEGIVLEPGGIGLAELLDLGSVAGKSAS